MMSRTVALRGTLLVALGLAISGMAQPGKSRSEPLVQGKSISDWSKALESGTVLDRIRAINALMRVGPEARKAAPALIRLFADREATLLHPLATVVLARMGSEAVSSLEKALQSKEATVRANAALTLGQIGSEARRAVPSLTRVLADPESSVQLAACQALGRIGRSARPALPQLTELLKDRDLLVRLEAADALWKIAGKTTGLSVLDEALKDSNPVAVQRALSLAADIGPRAKSLVKSVESHLTSKDVTLRLTAAETIYWITAEAGSVLPTITRTLASGDVSAKRQAVSTLGMLGNSDNARKLLARSLTSDGMEIRREAACACCDDQGKALVDTAALEQGLLDRDAGVRWWCALALLRGEADLRKQEEEILRAFSLDAKDEEELETKIKTILDVQKSSRAVPALVQVLRTRPARFQIEAARALGRLGVDLRPALEMLHESLTHPDVEVRRAVGDTLAASGVDALSQLIRRLDQPDSRGRATAARALGKMGLLARSALPSLVRLLKDADASVQIQAALALWNIEQNAEVALPLLNMVLKDVDNKDRWQAIEAIGVISVEARPPIRGITEILVNGLKDRDVRVRMQSARWLWRRVRQAKVVVPLLKDGITDRDTLARLIAVETLAEMSGEDRVAPLLVLALEDRDVRIRLAAERGLGRGGAVVVPILLDSLSSKNDQVRRGAIYALAALGPGAAEKAQPALTKLREDPDAATRAAVKHALQSLSGRKE